MARNKFWSRVGLGAVLILIIPVVGQAKSRAATPLRLSIPRLNVSAPIQARGVNWRKIMLPPSSAAAVAWYHDGVVPGQPGTAVMYGHLTDQHFHPAVFASLRKLKPKDPIVVTDAAGTKYTFVVTKLDTFRSDSITTSQLEPPTKFMHLTLYTCAGHWQPKLGKYSEYLVVYTTLRSIKSR